MFDCYSYKKVKPVNKQNFIHDIFDKSKKSDISFSRYESLSPGWKNKHLTLSFSEPF